MKNVCVFSLGFHDPKPLHKIVLRTWANSNFICFKFYTDRPDKWLSVLPEKAKNIDVVEISLQEFFAKFYPVLGYNNAGEFIDGFSWMIRPEGFEFLGYYAAQLRPLLFQTDPMDVDLWGWIDNDVMIHAEALERHLANASASMIMFPQHTLFFEQFKLFSPLVDVAGTYHQMVAEYQCSRQRPPSPLEAQVVVRLAHEIRYSRDCVSFDRIAVHWIYYDYLVREHHPDGKAPCNFDLTLWEDLSILGEAGQELLCFIADTQVKTFDEHQAKEVEDGLSEKGSFLFRWSSSIP